MTDLVCHLPGNDTTAWGPERWLLVHSENGFCFKCCHGNKSEHVGLRRELGRADLGNIPLNISSGYLRAVGSERRPNFPIEWFRFRDREVAGSCLALLPACIRQLFHADVGSRPENKTRPLPSYHLSLF